VQSCWSEFILIAESFRPFTAAYPLPASSGTEEPFTPAIASLHTPCLYPQHHHYTPAGPHCHQSFTRTVGMKEEETSARPDPGHNHHQHRCKALSSRNSESYADYGCWSPEAASNTSTSSSSTPTASAASSPPPNSASSCPAVEEGQALQSGRRPLCTLTVKLPEGVITDVKYAPISSKGLVQREEDDKSEASLIASLRPGNSLLTLLHGKGAQTLMLNAYCGQSKRRMYSRLRV